MNWVWIYLAVWLAATVAGAAATWACRGLSWKLNFLDVPMHELHKQHAKAMPLLGGAAIIVTWTAITVGGTLAVIILQEHLPEFIRDHLSGIRQRLPLLGVIAGGGIALGIMGMIDDKKPMNWKLKLLLQTVICGLVVYNEKLRITLFIQNPYLTWAISLCWFLFIINAFNFFDNMDGMAAGVAFIASAIFTIVAALQGQHFVPVLGAVTAGAALGYYFFNRYPASIFMGDSGSQFLGFLLAAQGTLTVFYRAGTPTVAPVFIPLIVLALPVFDFFMVAVIRLRHGQPVWQGDHNHISHRFQRMGVSASTAVWLVHLLSLALGLGALSLLFLPTFGVIIILLQTAAILTLITIVHGIRPAKEN